MTQDTSDAQFRAFAGEYLRADPTAHFGPVLEKWRQHCGAYIPLRDSLLDIFEQERKRVSGHQPVAAAPAPPPPTPAPRRGGLQWILSDILDQYILNRYAIIAFVVV